MRRHVCSNGTAVNPDVRTEGWTGSVDRTARKHDGRERAISAAMDRKVDLHCDELSVFSNRGFVMRARRMALVSGHHIFSAVVDDLDWLARLPGEQGSEEHTS